MQIYDIIILGGGPAGYLAAERAGHAKLKTLLIEKRKLGGVCLNEGCVPSKALLHSAKVFDYAKHGEKYGVTTTGTVIDHEFVVKRKDRIISALTAGIGMQMKKNSVTVVNAFGEIKGKTNDGFELTADGNTYIGKQLLLCTGSEAIVPPIPGAKEGLSAGFVLTNREVLSMTTVPKRFTVIGGGVIGLEMASYFNSVGSEVTVIEMMNKIAGPTDKDISEILQKNYEKKGIKFKLNCTVTEIGANSVTYEEDGKQMTVECDKVLMSIGRRAVTAGYGLENIGVYVERGAIKTDEYGKTNIAGVWASGDVNGRSMLAHTAYRESEVAINNILGKKDRMRYNAIPSVIYTNPEVGCVGETEEGAKAKGIDVECVTVNMNYSGRYMAENEGGDGICKLVSDKKNRILIGAHVIGSYAGEFIVAAGIIVENQMRIEEIKEIVFPHPTVCEILREGIFML